MINRALWLGMITIVTRTWGRKNLIAHWFIFSGAPVVLTAKELVFFIIRVCLKWICSVCGKTIMEKYTYTLKSVTGSGHVKYKMNPLQCKLHGYSACKIYLLLILIFTTIWCSCQATRSTYKKLASFYVHLATDAVQGIFCTFIRYFFHQSVAFMLLPNITCQVPK